MCSIDVQEGLELLAWLGDHATQRNYKGRVFSARETKMKSYVLGSPLGQPLASAIAT